MNLLRFFTAGNVDDGKSTLIGRLLYDSHAVSSDVIETLSRQSKTKSGTTEIDLALLTDGLRAEREQGITIDVAYKYFNTNKRKFIIADTPGHIQYTRNMFTGASNADLAIILIDARNGITEQTKRHTIIASILRIPQILICVNKMDLVNYSEETFTEIERDYLNFVSSLSLKQILFIPVSAFEGDNVVLPSANMLWYKGVTLMNLLETLEIKGENKKENPRFQVQYVIRPQEKQYHDYRGFAGNVLSGVYKKGDRVVVLPADLQTTIERIEVSGSERNEASAGRPVIFHLKDNIDVSRGDSIVPVGQLPVSQKEMRATLCWMDHINYIPGQKMLLQQNSFRTKAHIKEITHRIDVHTNEKIPGDGSMKLNDLCKVLIKTAEPVSFDSYADNRKTGSFILINEHANQTIAAGTFD
jgi:sulfate adenylyltransferase subunit 1